MKKILWICLTTVALLAISCKDMGPGNDATAVQSLQLGNMALRFDGAPAEITTVVAKLTRPSFPDRMLSLTIVNSSASGTFQDVAVGVWHLKIDAKDSSGVIRYSGETDVNVLGGDITNISLQLQPTSGGIHISVTWGTVPVDSTVVNGNFEVGPAVTTYLSLNPGSTALTGWTVTRGQIDIIRYWQSYDGNRSVDLDGTPGRGGIRQGIRTLPGRMYQVRFAMAGNPEGSPTTKTMGLAAAGQNAEFTFNVTGKTITNMGWVTRIWNFTATDSVTTIEFFSLDPEPGLYGPALDAVSVQRVQ